MAIIASEMQQLRVPVNNPTDPAASTTAGAASAANNPTAAGSVNGASNSVTNGAFTNGNPVSDTNPMDGAGAITGSLSGPIQGAASTATAGPGNLPTVANSPVFNEETAGPGGYGAGSGSSSVGILSGAGRTSPWFGPIQGAQAPGSWLSNPTGSNPTQPNPVPAQPDPQTPTSLSPIATPARTPNRTPNLTSIGIPIPGAVPSPTTMPDPDRIIFPGGDLMPVQRPAQGPVPGPALTPLTPPSLPSYYQPTPQQQALDQEDAQLGSQALATGNYGSLDAFAAQHPQQVFGDNWQPGDTLNPAWVGNQMRGTAEGDTPQFFTADGAPVMPVVGNPTILGDAPGTANAPVQSGSANADAAGVNSSSLQGNTMIATTDTGTGILAGAGGIPGAGANTTSNANANAGTNTSTNTSVNSDTNATANADANTNTNTGANTNTNSSDATGGANVNTAYQQVLGRQGDTAGIAYWQNVLNQNPNMTQAQLNAAMTGGEQGVDKLAGAAIASGAANPNDTWSAGDNANNIGSGAGQTIWNQATNSWITLPNINDYTATPAAQTAAINPAQYAPQQAVAPAAPAAGQAQAGSVYNNIQDWTDPNNPLVQQAAAIGRMGAAMSGFSSGNDSMSQTGAQNAVLAQAMQGATTDANNQTQTSISNSQQATQANIAASQEQTQVAEQNAQDSTSIEGQAMNDNANIAIQNTAAQNQQLMAQLNGSIQAQLYGIQNSYNLQDQNSSQFGTAYNSLLTNLTNVENGSLDPTSKQNVTNSLINSFQQYAQAQSQINGVNIGNLFGGSGSGGTGDPVAGIGGTGTGSGTGNGP